MHPSPHDGAAARAVVVRCLSVPALQPVLALFTSPIDGILTHRHSGRSWACIGPENCPGAVHKAPTVWKGFAAARVWEEPRTHWLPVALEVTEALEEVLRGRDLAGELRLLYRDGSSGKGRRVVGELVDSRRGGPLAQAFPFRQAVERMFHSREIAWNVANPCAPKILAPVVVGQPPPAGAIAPQPAVEPLTPEVFAAQLARLRGQARAQTAARNGRK